MVTAFCPSSTRRTSSASEFQSKSQSSGCPVGERAILVLTTCTREKGNVTQPGGGGGESAEREGGRLSAFARVNRTPDS